MDHRVRARIALALGCLAALASAALLNRSAAAFEVADGVALVFPAAAVSVVAGVLLGWWGVAAVFIGLAVSPWGLAGTPALALLFAAVAAVQAAIPAAARLRPEGDTWRRTFRALAWATVLNTLASAALGVPAVAALSTPPLRWPEVLTAFVSWFLGDLTTVLLLALPFLVLVRPDLLMDEREVAALRAWSRRRRVIVLLTAVVGLVVAGMELLVPSGHVSIHWLAVFFLVPVLTSAATGGVGAGLLASGVTGTIYVTEVLRLVRPAGGADLFREVFSSYLNLMVFGGAAVVTGLFAGRSRALLAELNEHQRQLQVSFERVVTALAAAIEAKDPTTQGHVQRVAQVTVAVGKRLGISGARLELLRYAAILHDVGKIGVPEVVLNKSGPLSPSEMRLMEAHVEIGVEILSSVDILRPAVPFIRFHQERWDGLTEGVRFRGYFGLKGEEIPLEARIIAVVDAYDAMISDRPYREARSHGEAVAELRREAGAQFDPDAVEALLAVLGKPERSEVSDRWPVLGTAAPDWLFG